MKPIILRTAEPSDAECLARIHRSARAAAMPWLPVLHTPQEDVRYFSQVVLPRQTVCVAEMEGSPTGFIAFENDWINHLYVDPTHWREGVGTLLLHHAMKGAARLQLWTFQENGPAREFYAKSGFREAAFTNGAGNEERTPDVRMVWEQGAEQR
ncbi:GNAT family N-acetyltransferase [Hoeflea poritis]|uniref:GNAT family N-acetyltransferase n=1 Tax=Hoeflea poritis TaxID=2993659 RepID=A0ABT4VPX0_9HYPH|nr:GNAT family N-acetyltransferase [Hoeflea poritis]MDA4846754.1 GNAT family N-acetyltransferase [Hoeflea poritis]